MLHRIAPLLVVACVDAGPERDAIAPPTGPGTSTAVATKPVPLPGGYGVYNVKDFGAVGDGVANDAPAIRNALAAVGPAGGTVVFPPGTYLIATLDTLNCPPMTAGLCPKPGTTLVGAGATSILKRGPAAGGMFHQVGGGNYTVESLAIDANGAGAGGSLNFFSAISFVGATRVRVAHTRIFDSSGLPSVPGRHGILVHNSDHAVVAHNILEGGLRIKVGAPGSEVIVDGNIVDDANDNAISLALGGAGESADYVIRGNIVRRARGASIYIGSDDGASPQTVRNIVVDGNAISGPVLQGAAMIIVRTANPETGRIAITSNALDNSMAAKLPWTIGIVVTTQTTPHTQRAHDVAVVGNVIRGPFDYAGVWLRATDRSTITGNTVDCGDTTACNGAISVDNASDIAISSNSISNTSGGLLVYDSRRIAMTGNIVSNVGTAVYLVANAGITTSATVTSNVVANAATGVYEHPFSGGAYDTMYALNDLRGAATPTNPAQLGTSKLANRGIDHTSSTWDPPAVAPGTCATTTLAIAHATAGDAVAVTFTQPLPAGAMLAGSASTGAVAIALCGIGSGFDLASGTLTASTSRP
jgi:parallel beta-helix repeat protein